MYIQFTNIVAQNLCSVFQSHSSDIQHKSHIKIHTQSKNCLCSSHIQVILNKSLMCSSKFRTLSTHTGTYFKESAPIILSSQYELKVNQPFIKLSNQPTIVHLRSWYNASKAVIYLVLV